MEEKLNLCLVWFSPPYGKIPFERSPTIRSTIRDVRMLSFERLYVSKREVEVISVASPID